ncbi:hypothetical protein AQUCO_11200009v1 [Aquilegia coerulea]|uniref:Uncharacterized protein n=1 Tax=Aquilegia coerulea TaxID=218851 RepID=A0A2G5C2J4_AQUCA|nr:hypothetical protein AQUCO_11200009v1 [Aquilegia coerulea]
MRRNNRESYVGRRYSILDIHTFDQSLGPKSIFAHYKPLPPYPVPPSPPIYPPPEYYNIFPGSSKVRNKYPSASLYPTKEYYNFPQHVTNPLVGPPMNNDNEEGTSMSFPESPSNYLLDEPLLDDYLDFASFIQ